MKAYILKDKYGEFANTNCAIAYDGFRQMGWEIVPFKQSDNPLLPDLTSEDVVVGFIEAVQTALLKLKITLPDAVNYPDELSDFLGRKVWHSHINFIAKHPELWGIFIKPVTSPKKFKGRLLTSVKDLISCGDEFEDTEIWCSEPVKFLAEWRCFVRYGEILGVKSYAGDWRVHFDSEIIENAIAAYTSAPAGYAADFGVTDKGETLLIEINDGYSIGAYGLFPLDYARLLASRWAQITGSKDYSIY
jgi:hypothetical protein